MPRSTCWQAGVWRWSLCYSLSISWYCCWYKPWSLTPARSSTVRAMMTGSQQLPAFTINKSNAKKNWRRTKLPMISCSWLASLFFARWYCNSCLSVCHAWVLRQIGYTVDGQTTAARFLCGPQTFSNGGWAPGRREPPYIETWIHPCLRQSCAAGISLGNRMTCSWAMKPVGNTERTNSRWLCNRKYRTIFTDVLFGYSTRPLLPLFKCKKYLLIRDGKNLRFKKVF